MVQTKQLQSLARFSSRLAICLALIVSAIVSAGLLSFVGGDSLISYAYSARGTIACDPGVQIIAVYTNDDEVIDNPDLDPIDNGIDPGYDKAVAACHAKVDDVWHAQVWVANGYPSYTCQFWVVVKNTGSKVIQRAAPSITTPAELTVRDVDAQPASALVKPAGIEIESFTVHLEQTARERSVYRFSIAKRFSIPKTGTVGFWREWDSHDTYSRSELETWLAKIDATSERFSGLARTDDMDVILKAALSRRATPETRFRAQYLALRLNERSGRFSSSALHDVSAADPANYLGVADPKATSLTEIIQQIEAKGFLSDAESTILKDICDGLNNADF